MTYLNPQCAKCMRELNITWCDRVCKHPKRSLVEMELTDSDLGYANRRQRQHNSDTDYHRHYDKTRKHEKRGV